MEKGQLERITEETYHFLNNKKVGFICCVWDKEGGEFAGGCQSADADIGDAMVTIIRIIEHFNIDPNRLAIALRGVKLDMERN